MNLIMKFVKLANGMCWQTARNQTMADKPNEWHKLGNLQEFWGDFL